VDLSPLKIDRQPKKTRRHGRSRLPWLPIFLLLAVAAAIYWFRTPLTSWMDSVRLPEVEAMRVQRSHPAALGAVTGTAANGYVVAARRAALSADTPGRIVEMNVTEGSVVRKGDVVARLYSDEYVAALARTEAELRAAQATQSRSDVALEAARDLVERQRQEEQAADANLASLKEELAHAEREEQRFAQLVGEGVATVREHDQASNRLLVAKARVRQAQAQKEAAAASLANSIRGISLAEEDQKVSGARVEVARAARNQSQATLDKTEVRAPFDGVVVLKDAEVGEVVSPNSQGGSSARGSVVTMVDFDSLEVQAEVPETSLAAVRIEGRAKIFLDAFPERAYEGRVDRIWPTANRQKATVEVRVAFHEPDDRLRPDMGVRVVFVGDQVPEVDPVVDTETAILVPEDAVVRVGGQSGAFVLERDQAVFVALTLGERRGGRVAATDGLIGGERIILKPPTHLQSGDRVRVKEQ
jgi:RND family efflux transporter MFP subunit